MEVSGYFGILVVLIFSTFLALSLPEHGPHSIAIIHSITLKIGQLKTSQITLNLKTIIKICYLGHFLKERLPKISLYFLGVNDF